MAAPSVTRRHADWLSLVETSGPFLSLGVLKDTFPQGVEPTSSDLRRVLRQAFEEWEDDQLGSNPDGAIHAAWIRYVLREGLGYVKDVLSDTADVPASMSAHLTDHNETLRPDLILVDPDSPIIGGRGADSSDSLPSREGQGVGSVRLLINTYPRRQSLDKALAGSHWAASPIARMAELLLRGGHKLGLVTNGEQWTLVSRCADTLGTATWQASLWFEESTSLDAFLSLAGAHRFFAVAADKTLEALLTDSANDQTEVTTQLGDQVRRAVEVIVRTIDRIDKDRHRQLLAGVHEKALYEAALTVMMRLVFLFCAEERDLLPLDNATYAVHYAASTLRAQLRESADQYGEEILERRFDAWSRFLATFRAVHGGVEHTSMRLPAYGGTLFDPDRFPFLEGRSVGTDWHVDAAAPLAIDNLTVLRLLEALQILQIKLPGGPAEPRRLSFRSLDIEQIGHVYEGLLDHTAVRATGPVLGLAGIKGKEPEIPLSTLEEMRDRGEAALLKYLKEQTGKSESALTKALQAGSNGTLGLVPPLLGAEGAVLREACDHDDALFARVLPFAGLIRETFGKPVVITTNSVYVTQGSDRRSTGTHYTPRSLTEPVVRRTLEPVVYRGVSEGVDPSPETLKTPEEILALKICDMTTGSGAFLVEACRYLSARLVEAWTRKADADPNALLVLPGATPSTGHAGERILGKDPEELLTIARRAIVDRCLYGVDKNPMAVEMAKLSLWLITMERDRPFTFVDHAIKAGDSLVGVDMDQLRTWSLDGDGGTLNMFVYEAIGRAKLLREQLEQLAELGIEDIHRKERLHREAEAAVDRAKLSGDLILAPSFVTTKAKEQDALRKALLADFITEPEGSRDADLCSRCSSMLGDVSPFHWPLEFPEVFQRENGGFDAIVGNPPFMGGQKITGEYGVPYREFLVEGLGRGKKGSADLVAYFFLRAGGLVRKQGSFGLIATNTIAQGDSRETGLDQLTNAGASIYAAIPSMKWPGQANLEVSVCHLHVGPWAAPRQLAAVSVSHITSLLDDGSASGRPSRLRANDGLAFKGSEVNGMGFILDVSEATRLIASDSRNAEVVFPYMTGEDLNSRPDLSGSRWIIDFGTRTLSEASAYPDCLQILYDRVKPERDVHSDDRVRKYWWQFKRPAKDLRAAMAGKERVLAVSLVNNHLGFGFCPTNVVLAHRLGVFPLVEYSAFAVLQSHFHYHWAWTYSSTLRLDINYSPSDCFQTYPFPLWGFETEERCAAEGLRYYSRRREYMLTNQVGLTKTYNLFHDSRCLDADIDELRRLHVEMDTAVRDAYGWDDLALDHDFYGEGKETRFTISPKAKQEVLRRLLKLNHERAAEELALGLSTKGKSGKGKSGKGARASTSIGGISSGIETLPGLDLD